MGKLQMALRLHVFRDRVLNDKDQMVYLVHHPSQLIVRTFSGSSRPAQPPTHTGREATHAHMYRMRRTRLIGSGLISPVGYSV